MSLGRRLTAEGVGTALLLAGVVGSGIMGERLAGGNVALALLANTVATGAVLVALILTFGPISGAHLNPAVTLADAWAGGLAWRDVAGYTLAQVGGAFAGVASAHLMFGEPLFAPSQHERAGMPQLWSEFVATFGPGSDPGRRAPTVCGAPIRGGRLHHGGVLVHRLHLIRQSCGHARPRRNRHVRWHPTGGRPGVHRGAVARRGGGHRAVPVASAASGPRAVGGDQKP